MSEWYEHEDIFSATTAFHCPADCDKDGFSMRVLRDAGVLEMVVDVTKHKGLSKSGKTNTLATTFASFYGKTGMYTMKNMWTAGGSNGLCGDDVPVQKTQCDNVAHASSGSQLHLYFNLNGSTRQTGKSLLLATLNEFKLHGNSKTGCNFIVGFKTVPTGALAEHLASLPTVSWPTPIKRNVPATTAKENAIDTDEKADIAVARLKIELAELEARVKVVKEQLTAAENEVSKKRMREEEST